MERLRDQQERADFEKRLAEREDKSTKKVAGGSKRHKGEGDADGDDPAAAATHKLMHQDPATMTEEERDQALNDLRKVSRRTYLEKREAREIQLLEEQVRFEEENWGDKLSVEERRRLEINKRIIELAKGKTSMVEDAPRYRMPDMMEDEEGRLRKDKRDEVLTARYKEKPGGDAHKS